MDRIAGSSESSHLLVDNASENSFSPFQQKSVYILCPPSKHLCLPSKAAILILLLTVILGAMYHDFISFSAFLIFNNSPCETILSMYEPLPCTILAIVMMSYPLSGFIADIRCGCLKTVVVSLMFLLSCWISVTIASLVLQSIPQPDSYTLTHNKGIFVMILISISLFTFVIGLAGYQANFIQLGLDQLFEAPNQYLALFIHYAVWIFCLGSLHFELLFFLVFCAYPVC